MGSYDIFIIDDDEALAKSLRFMLSRLRLRCRSFASAGDFLKALPSLQRGCILSDILMPGLSGLALQRELERRGLDWPIIFMTGGFYPETVRRAMKAGAVDVIPKPMVDEALFKALQRSLSRMRIIRPEVSAA